MTVDGDTRVDMMNIQTKTVDILNIKAILIEVNMIMTITDINYAQIAKLIKELLSSMLLFHDTILGL